MSSSTAPRLSAIQAKRLLLGHLGLMRQTLPDGDAGARLLLKQLRCVQLDPLDPLGTNADLVAMARVSGLKRGQIYDALLPGHGFEHWAKERCLLPPEALPWYRQHVPETSWWSMSERERRLPDGVLERVLEEVELRGPATPSELTHHGKVQAMDWSGWKGTSSATTMALEVLWKRCQVLVCGRTGNGKRYDVPHRALPEMHGLTVDTSPEAFGRWSLTERAQAAGLLSRAKGPQWGMMGEVHASDLPERMVREGALVCVTVEGSGRTYLAPPEALDTDWGHPDGRMRILGPLDPAIWDRKLVQQAFGFEYIWEVYKPQDKRRWGWYVCPLLHGEALVGRLEGRVVDDVLRIETVWQERAGSVDPVALDEALERHRQAMGAKAFKRPKIFKG